MSRAADRQRRARERRKRGLACFKIEAEHDALVEAAIRAGILTEDEALHPRAVERALTAVLQEWAARWLE